MTNYEIADAFSLLSKLMDINGENSFRSKSFAAAAFQIEKLPTPLAAMTTTEIAAQKGIGSTTGQKIQELLQTGKLDVLQHLIETIPPGVIEMLHIKGLGPKKIHTIWKEMGIESIGELQYACHENRLTLYKGFGEKTQKNVADAISFYLNQQGLFLFQQAEILANALLTFLQASFSNYSFAPTGALRRQDEIVDTVELLTTAPLNEVAIKFTDFPLLSLQSSTSAALTYTADNGPIVMLHFANADNWGWHLLHTTGTPAFFEAMQSKIPQGHYPNEASIFENAGLPFIPACLRNDNSIIEQAINKGIPKLIQPDDIKGIIHSHTVWSDGSNTVEDMAVAAKAAGLEYLVVSDHSRSASYANGLSVERIIQQQAAIDALNKKLYPFKIFKSIECDILGDGSLDYSDDVLASFDLVIASVHANLKMTEEKAMQRLLQAISNPYVTILGHMTGRLLLSRNGYPVNHSAIIAACVANHVVIEINAHPRRLDIDWRWIPEALQKGALLSINPDAHAIEGFADTRYGVLAAQKGGLTAIDNLSSFSLSEFEDFLFENKKSKGLLD